MKAPSGRNFEESLSCFIYFKNPTINHDNIEEYFAHFMIGLDQMSLVLSCFFVSFAFASYDKYLATSLAKTLPEDVEILIQEFHQELEHLISDLSQFNTIVLPFRDSVADVAKFIYFAETPMYHLKRNHRLPLFPVPYINEKLVRFTFKHISGDCTALDIMGERRSWMQFMENPSIPNGLSLKRDATTGIHLEINRRLMRRNAELFVKFYLHVPKNCILYITAIERHVVITGNKALRRQLKYSTLEDRPAELIGLISATIHNLDDRRFILESADFPALTLVYNSRRIRRMCSRSRLPYT